MLLNVFQSVFIRILEALSFNDLTDELTHKDVPIRYVAALSRFRLCRQADCNSVIDIEDAGVVSEFRAGHSKELQSAEGLLKI